MTHDIVEPDYSYRSELLYKNYTDKNVCATFSSPSLQGEGFRVGLGENDII
jgi:hypothetical protein